MVLAKEARYSEAATHYLNAIKAYEKGGGGYWSKAPHADVYLALAEALEKAGQRDEAQRWRQKVRNLDSLR
jgi:TolA-binding protein